MVESLKLSLTDQQLPMFIRLMELGVALYYGEMGVHRDAEEEESGSLGESVSGEFLILSKGFVSEAVQINSLHSFVYCSGDCHVCLRASQESLS